MFSKRCGIFIRRQFSVASRQEFFPEHSTEKRCKYNHSKDLTFAPLRLCAFARTTD